jgi:hypothetical protein
LLVHADSDNAATAASATRPVLRIMEGRTSW